MVQRHVLARDQHRRVIGRRSRGGSCSEPRNVASKPRSLRSSAPGSPPSTGGSTCHVPNPPREPFRGQGEASGAPPTARRPSTTVEHQRVHRSRARPPREPSRGQGPVPAAGAPPTARRLSTTVEHQRLDPCRSEPHESRPGAPRPASAGSRFAARPTLIAALAVAEPSGAPAHERRQQALEGDEPAHAAEVVDQDGPAAPLGPHGQ